MNAYEMKAGVVSLQCKNCGPYLSFLQWDAVEIYLPLPFFNSNHNDGYTYQSLKEMAQCRTTW